MISSITVQNLRVFEGQDWVFPLTGLTVFCGTNSAGKSTLLKVPLLLRQSQSNSTAAANDEGTLRFVGPQVDLGSFGALVTDNDLTLPLGLGVRTVGEINSDSVDWLISLNSETLPSIKRSRRGQEVEPYELDSLFQFSASEGHSEAAPDIRDHHLIGANFKILARSEVVLEWSLEPRVNSVDGAYQLRLPTNYCDGEFAGLGAMNVYTDVAEDVESGATVPVGVSLNGLLPNALIASVNAPGFEGESTKLPLPLDISKPLEDLQKSLDGVHYLGPLRTPAERFYIASEDSAPVFDPSGDFLPYVLRDRADEEIPVVLPFESNSNTVSLTSAISSWLYFLRTGETEENHAEELRVEATRGVLVELSIQSSSGERSHPLADSGFGYSQVLPILVRGLLAKPGETVVIEQPELHLHPALQVRVASFLVSLAQSGRQVIVETHSEHVVNAMRVSAAEDSTGEIARLSRIVFVNGSASPPTLHSLSIHQDGTVPDWPREFFGESLELSGRLLRAQRTQKKR